MAQTTTTQAPTLMTIPLEIRTEILTLVLTTHPPIPKTYTTLPTRIQECGIFHSTQRNVVDLYPVLLTSRDIHAECVAIISHLVASGKNDFALDVMIVQEQTFWPTWLQLTSPNPQVDLVRATFRAMDAPKEQRRSGFRRGCGGPPTIWWKFYNLLARFLDYEGVYAFSGRPSKEPGHTGVKPSIRTLEVDFVTPDVNPGYIVSTEQLEASDITDLYELGSLRKEHRIPYVLPADALATEMVNFVHKTLAYTAESEKYGRMLFEKIGKIRISGQGVCLEEFDIGEMLEEMEFPQYRKAKEEHEWKNWKEMALECRMETGLSKAEE